jgi:3',5'-cyclic AMP phosphodiesterase CpdA
MIRKIAHISDLHFGTVNPKTAEGLASDLGKVAPTLVVVSGDLTQRARSGQFKKAKNYLEKIRFPKIIVPGNHDIPLFDIFTRLIFPLRRFKKFIGSNMFPLFADEEIAVLGINTARSITWKNGRISLKQIDEMEKILCSVDNKIFKIVVTHHPFIPPPGDPGIDLVGRSAKALKVIDECGVDLLLAGHLHHGYSGDIRPFYASGRRSVISAQAGTAISDRVRGEPNAYNLISVENNSIQIEIRVWDGNEFQKSDSSLYKKNNNEWIRIDN